MGDNSSPNQITVLVTGFGPFATHNVNASWSAVMELAKRGLGEEASHINLVTLEIPVKYNTVSKAIPQLWETHRPQLVVHVGVSGIAKLITLEQQAFNKGYNKADECGCLPNGECCIEGAMECISSNIDMHHVCDYINRSNCKVNAVVSNDPGRYLCDFIYFTSLNISRDSTAFIHVPPLDKPYSAQELAEGVRLAIIAMLKQLRLT